MKNKKYFQLFSCCKLVKGYSRTLICDLQKEDFIYISNEYFTLFDEQTASINLVSLQSVLESKFSNSKKALIYIYTLLNKLEGLGYGQYIDSLEEFPSLNLSIESPSLISNVIIDLKTTIFFDINKLSTDLAILNCKSVQLRIFDKFDLQLVKNILHSLSNTTIRSISLSLPYDLNLSNHKKVFHFFNDYPLCTTVIFHSSNKDKQYNLTGLRVIFTTQSIDSEKCCGFVSPYYFRVNSKLYSEALNYNSCLNKKLSIDKDGNIKNCPALNEEFGKYAETDFTKLIEILESKEFKRLQNIKKDNVLICQDCEFRYICHDCRAFVQDSSNPYSKPKKCSYDPYSGVWN